MAVCKTRLLQEDIENILKEKRMLVNELFNEFDIVNDNCKKERANFIVNNIDYEMEEIANVSCTFIGLISQKKYFYIEEELENIKINFMLRFNVKMNEHYFKNINV